VNSPTRPNQKYSIIYLILTNAPHKYSSSVVPLFFFPNDIHDHFLIASVRNKKNPKSRLLIIFKRVMKQVSLKVFLLDLYGFDWGRRHFIYDRFTGLVNKYKDRVKG